MGETVTRIDPRTSVVHQLSTEGATEVTHVQGYNGPQGFQHQEREQVSISFTPQRQSQFTPKMKANADSRLLSSLV